MTFWSSNKKSMNKTQSDGKNCIPKFVQQLFWQIKEQVSPPLSFLFFFWFEIHLMSHLSTAYIKSLKATNSQLQMKQID